MYAGLICWYGVQESNLQHVDYESIVLTIELTPRLIGRFPLGANKIGGFVYINFMHKAIFTSVFPIVSSLITVCITIYAPFRPLFLISNFVYLILVYHVSHPTHNKNQDYQ